MWLVGLRMHADGLECALLRGARGPPGAEEGGELLAALSCKNACGDGELVIEPRMIEHDEDRAAGAGLRVVGGVDKVV